jgi:hypothetical protein
MKSATTQNRQTMIIYLVAIVFLFAAMYPYKFWFLDPVKAKYQLGEATIGQVDAGSFMLKLALLGGARGIAANVLWTKAIELQKVQEWDRLEATVDLITKLQPHFLAVWTFQSWNLAYNVSVEWDAPEDKYVWIKKGIQFAADGVAKNKNSPDLIWDTASIYYHKIGFSDESIILRRLFRDDDDDGFKTDPMENQVRNDNFQLAHGWFVRAVKLVDDGGQRLTSAIEANPNFVDPPPQRKGRPGDLAFRSMPSHAQTRYAAGLEKQSVKGIQPTFGEVARAEWGKALAEWSEFGKYTYPSHNDIEVQGKLVHQPIRLDDVLRQNELAKLADDTNYWAQVLELPTVTKEEAQRLTANKIHWTQRWADQVNYPYWTDRAKTEMEPQGVEARKLFYEGTRAYKSGDYPEAGKKFKEGLVLWDDLLKRHPVYRNDSLNQKDTGLILRRYTRVLANLSEPIPDDLPFKDLLATDQDIAPDPFDALEMLPAAPTTK